MEEIIQKTKKRKEKKVTNNKYYVLLLTYNIRTTSYLIEDNLRLLLHEFILKHKSEQSNMSFDIILLDYQKKHKKTQQITKEEYQLIEYILNGPLPHIKSSMKAICNSYSKINHILTLIDTISEDLYTFCQTSYNIIDDSVEPSRITLSNIKEKLITIFTDFSLEFNSKITFDIINNFTSKHNKAILKKKDQSNVICINIERKDIIEEKDTEIDDTLSLKEKVRKPKEKNLKEKKTKKKLTEDKLKLEKNNNIN
jgi:hypothetical protein